MHNFKKANIDLNRKMLSQIAILDNQTFNELIEISK
jgi:ribosomal protein L20